MQSPPRLRPFLARAAIADSDHVPTLLRQAFTLATTVITLLTGGLGDVPCRVDHEDDGRNRYAALSH
jgi:hypothetical protein